jgi:hypothetical protein
MNRKQKICLWIGIAFFVLLGLFPPTKSTPWAIQETTQRPITRYHRSIDGSKLFAYLAMVAVITGGLIVTLKDKKPKDEK